MAEILLMKTKNKAICMIHNALVKCYNNTINLWKHLISRIRRHDIRYEWMNGGWRDALFVYYTHTKVLTMLAVFSVVSLYDINTSISSPAALRVTSLVSYRLIWEKYHHITYTPTASSSWQPVKIKVQFNVKDININIKKLCQNILLFSTFKTQCYYY